MVMLISLDIHFGCSGFQGNELRGWPPMEHQVLHPLHETEDSLLLRTTYVVSNLC